MKLLTEACVGEKVWVGGLYVDCFPCAGNGKGGLTVMLVARVEGLFLNKTQFVLAVRETKNEEDVFGM